MKPFLLELEFSNGYVLYKDRGTDIISVEKKAPVALHYGIPPLFL